MGITAVENAQRAPQRTFIPHWGLSKINWYERKYLIRISLPAAAVGRRAAIPPSVVRAPVVSPGPAAKSSVFPATRARSASKGSGSAPEVFALRTPRKGGTIAGIRRRFTRNAEAH